jgi:hypothetical protein
VVGIQLDPTPLITSSDPDYRLIYEAVVERAEARFRAMHGEG